MLCLYPQYFFYAYGAHPFFFMASQKKTRSRAACATILNRKSKYVHARLEGREPAACRYLGPSAAIMTPANLRVLAAQFSKASHALWDLVGSIFLTGQRDPESFLRGTKLSAGARGSSFGRERMASYDIFDVRGHDRTRLTTSFSLPPFGSRRTFGGADMIRSTISTSSDLISLYQFLFGFFYSETILRLDQLGTECSGRSLISLQPQSFCSCRRSTQPIIVLLSKPCPS